MIRVERIALHQENLKVFKVVQGRRKFVIEANLIAGFFSALKGLTKDKDIDNKEKFWDVFLTVNESELQKAVKLAVNMTKEQEKEEEEKKEKEEEGCEEGCGGMCEGTCEGFENTLENKSFLKRYEKLLEIALTLIQIKRFKALVRKSRAIVSFNLSEELFDVVSATASRSDREAEIDTWLEVSEEIALKKQKKSMSKVDEYLEKRKHG